MTDTRKLAAYSDFDYVCTSVKDILGTLPLLRHVSKTKLRQFSFDIAIVAFAMRCGYLFDAFGLRSKHTTLKDFLSEVLTKLRKTLPAFETVTLVYHNASDQLFFVSIPRFRACYKLDNGGLSESLLAWVAFVEVRGSSAKVCPPPAGLSSVFSAIAINIDTEGTPPIVITLPDDGDPPMGLMVAFAACILEFPVAYVPVTDGPEGGGFLSGVPLDVYEGVLIPYTAGTTQVHTDHETRILVKFSCPQTIGLQVPELSPKSLMARVAARFEERVATSRKFVVRHSVETLDRVAM
ncbi:hypothetical protein L226DRAFT_532641 [Lentinus tigrinus ALCF2SS1-7]|uniref:Uncharacterized protein n=1 Tax=Lentinus tigrinus ALCF2SS1-6 TaxID=1328759 RepID=A0A5C2SF98_9APHY|nr:hypothetical protein L227DRAFT_573541 [Lentinus tigrinus ALCF2SS1-6]RPD77882.1 hypothetical protein L226DRAFT_532641 [Lentinus tigrinus ALCF2SS1-7]